MMYQVILPVRELHEYNKFYNVNYTFTKKSGTVKYRVMDIIKVYGSNQELLADSGRLFIMSLNNPSISSVCDNKEISVPFENKYALATFASNLSKMKHTKS